MAAQHGLAAERAEIDRPDPAREQLAAGGGQHGAIVDGIRRWRGERDRRLPRPVAQHVDQPRARPPAQDDCARLVGEQQRVAARERQCWVRARRAHRPEPLPALPVVERHGGRDPAGVHGRVGKDAVGGDEHAVAERHGRLRRDAGVELADQRLLTPARVVDVRDVGGPRRERRGAAEAGGARGEGDGGDEIVPAGVGQIDAFVRSGSGGHAHQRPGEPERVAAVDVEIDVGRAVVDARGPHRQRAGPVDVQQRRVAHVRRGRAARRERGRIEQRQGVRGAPFPRELAGGADTELTVGGGRRGREREGDERGRGDARGKPPDPAPRGQSR